MGALWSLLRASVDGISLESAPFIVSSLDGVAAADRHLAKAGKLPYLIGVSTILGNRGPDCSAGLFIDIDEVGYPEAWLLATTLDQHVYDYGMKLWYESAKISSRKIKRNSHRAVSLIHRNVAKE